MKAAFIRTHGNASRAFEIKEVNNCVPNVDQLVVEVDTFGLNYADVMARKGLYKDAPELPFIPGYEVVGRVIEIREGCRGKVKVGDRVLAFTRFNGYATRVVVKEEAVVQLSDQIRDAEAVALATQYCTAWYAGVVRANFMPNETILVHAGAGGVGIGLIQLAQQKGCKIIATVGSEEKVKFLKQQGVKTVVNYRSKDFVSELKDLGFQGKIDVVFDPIGGKNFRRNVKLLAKGGRMVMYGVSTWSHKKGTLLDKIKLAWDFGLLHPIELLVRSQSIIGVNMLRIADERPNIIEEGLKEMVKLYKEGVVAPVVGGEYRIEELSKAHEMLENRSTIGKVSVSWNAG